MPLRLPVRRFLHCTDKTQAPAGRIGSVQWVLSRPLYRFHLIDLAQVPAKNRPQALGLELAQWTPFANSAYYVGWHGQQALVWAWDADTVTKALLAQNLKPQRVHVVPETALHNSLHSGLALVRCLEGFEGQIWRNGQLTHSRWWAQTPGSDEWLMFQRDGAVPHSEQQTEPPAARSMPLATKPWVRAAGSADNKANQIESIVMAMGALVLLVPTLWFGFGLYKLHASTALLSTQKAQLQSQVTPIAQARSQALDSLARIQALQALAPTPEPLWLMAKVTQALPQDKSFIKDWDLQGTQLKFTVNSAFDVSTTNLIGLLQQAGPFKDVKALPGRDNKSVTFQMEVQVP